MKSQKLFSRKSNQNVKQWYFLKCAVSCRLTISRSLWHVRHFVTMHMTKDMCISFGAHKTNWVFRSLCFTNLCFQCECYFNLVLYTALCMFVKCDTCNSYGNKIDLIWFDLVVSRCLHRWSPEMDKLFHPTHYDGCNYFFVLWFKLIHVSKRLLVVWPIYMLLCVTQLDAIKTDKALINPCPEITTIVST